MPDSDNRQNNTVTTNKKSVPEQRPNRAGTLTNQTEKRLVSLLYHTFWTIASHSERNYLHEHEPEPTGNG